MLGRFVRQPSGYTAFVPSALPRAFDLSAEVGRLAAEATAALGHLSGIVSGAADADLLLRPALRLEALSSSRIEGTRTEVDALLRAPADVDDLDIGEVRANVAAQDRAFELTDTLPISQRLLREAHAVLLSDPRHVTLTPGELRRTQNWIGPPGATLGTATFVPPPPAEMRRALDDLEHFVHEHRLPVVVAAGVAHYQFEAIHPFLDGNGRIGRILVLLVLVDGGVLGGPHLHLSTHLEAHRSEYVRLLGETSRTGDLDPWLRFFLAGLRDSAVSTEQRFHRMRRTLEALRVTVADAGLAPTAVRLVEHLVVDPYVRVPELVDVLDVATPTAQRAVDGLVAAGVLREVTGNRRNRVYVADTVLDAVYRDPTPGVS